MQAKKGKPMLHCQGVIDFAKLTAPPERMPAFEPEGDLAAVALPGIELRWNPAFADVAFANGKFALAWGRARDTGTASIGGEAGRWLERYARDGERAPEEVGGGFAALILDFVFRKALLFVDRFSIETACYRW